MKKLILIIILLSVHQDAFARKHLVDTESADAINAEGRRLTREMLVRNYPMLEDLDLIAQQNAQLLEEARITRCARNSNYDDCTGDE
jgi:hypothetical protein